MMTTYQLWVNGAWVAFEAATTDEAWSKAFAIYRERKAQSAEGAR